MQVPMQACTPRALPMCTHTHAHHKLAYVPMQAPMHACARTPSRQHATRRLAPPPLATLRLPRVGLQAGWLPLLPSWPISGLPMGAGPAQQP